MGKECDSAARKDLPLHLVKVKKNIKVSREKIETLITVHNSSPCFLLDEMKRLLADA